MARTDAELILAMAEEMGVDAGRPICGRHSNFALVLAAVELTKILDERKIPDIYRLVYYQSLSSAFTDKAADEEQAMEEGN